MMNVHLMYCFFVPDFQEFSMTCKTVSENPLPCNYLLIYRTSIVEVEHAMDVLLLALVALSMSPVLANVVLLKPL